MWGYGGFQERVPRSVIMQGGGWRSLAIDSYIRVEDAGVRMGDALL